MAASTNSWKLLILNITRKKDTKNIYLLLPCGSVHWWNVYFTSVCCFHASRVCVDVVVEEGLTYRSMLKSSWNTSTLLCILAESKFAANARASSETCCGENQTCSRDVMSWPAAALLRPERRMSGTASQKVVAVSGIPLSLSAPNKLARSYELSKHVFQNALSSGCTIAMVVTKTMFQWMAGWVAIPRTQSWCADPWSSSLRLPLFLAYQLKGVTVHCEPNKNFMNMFSLLYWR